jgi:hypothetical protein
VNTTPLTAEELDYLREGLKRELPHLSCVVEQRGETLHVKAVKV